MGSFYNHFDSKEELFQAAVNEVLDDVGALARQADRGVTRIRRRAFARSFRLVGRICPATAEHEPRAAQHRRGY